MSNKLTKIGKSTLSLILCLTMLLTTFCFFDIGSVISEAMISKDEHDLSAAGASSNAFSKYSINFPELVYKKAGKTYSEYFLNNDASGNVEGAKSEIGNFSFSCSTAKTVAFSAKLYNTDLATQPGVYIKSISMADGRKLTGQKNTNGTDTLSITAGSYSTHITSIDFSEVAPGTEYIIEWTITYTVTADGNTKYTTYAYTGVKSPALGQAGLVQFQYYGGLLTSSTSQSSYSFIAGADSVDGGNAASAFTNYSGTVSTKSKLSPLVTFVGSATNGTNYTMPTGRDVVNSADYFPATNNGGVFRYYDEASRSKIWNVPGDGSDKYTPLNGNKEIKLNSSYGNATISIDRSRFTDFNQIPNLSCGYAQFFHHWEGYGNKLYNIRNALYAGWDAAEYWKKYKTENLSTNSKGAKSVSLYCNVDRSNEDSKNDNSSYVRGPYAINGSIPTSSGSTYMRFEAMNGYESIINEEICVVVASVKLTYNISDKANLRKAYYECMNSGVNNQANASGGQYWDQYLANLKTMAKELCVSTNTSVTIPTGYNTVITNAQNELKKKMTADVSAPVYLYVPEAVYLKPSVTSWKSATSSNFQYFIQNDISNPAKPVTKSTKDTTGTVFFSYPNASEVTIQYKWLNTSGSEISSSSTINFAGSALSSGTAKSLTLSNGAGTFSISNKSLSPSLANTANGCYIQWIVNYKDSIDNYKKSVIAYTYVYKPYTVPAIAATRTKNNGRFYDTFMQHFAWISGSQGLESEGDYYGRFGFSGIKSTAAFLTDEKANGIISNDLSGTDGVTFDTDKNRRMYTAFASTTAASSYFYCGQTNSGINNKPVIDWLCDSKERARYNIKNAKFADYDKNDDAVMTVNEGLTAKLTVDISRYNNFSQIPNFGVGLMITDSENCTNGAFEIADYTDKTNSYSNNASGNWNNMKNCYNDVGDILIRQGDLDKRSSAAKDCGLKYTGSWNKELSNKVSDYKVKFVTFGKRKDHSYYVQNVSFIGIKTTLYDKSSLRTAVNDAIANFANFGIYDSANMKSYYFEGTEYDSFVSAFKKACQALTKVDGAIDDPTTLANSLNTCTNNLLQLKSLKSNCTAKQYNIGLVRQGDKYLAVDIKSTDENPHVMSYNARDNVTFSPDHFDGYTYSGSVELTSDSLKNREGIETIYGAYLNCVDNKPKITYLTEDNKESSEIELSGSTITVNKTLTETTTVPTFEGDTIHYNWVAAVNDPSLTVVSFYVLNPDVLFDNEFDFDSVSWYTSGVSVSSCIIDYAANSIQITASGDNCFVYPPTTAMNLIAGHTYRITYNCTNAEKSRLTVLTSASASTGFGAHSGYLESPASGDTFTVSSAYPYVVLRPGILNSKAGDSITYSDIYVQDITNYKGIVDDVTGASPHGLYNHAPNTALGSVASITRTGYHFDGWFDSQDATGNGTGTQYTAGSKTPYTNLKLFSKWTVNKITLKYDGNNRTDGVSVPDQTFEYGDSVTTAETPKREYKVTYNAMNGTVSPTSDTAKYTFAGWKSSAVGGDDYYQAGKAYDDGFGVTGGSVTLTAMWKDGGLTLPTPTRTGYTFDGWYTDSGCTNAVTLASDGKYYATSNTTLYAKWNINSYTFDLNGYLKDIPKEYGGLYDVDADNSSNYIPAVKVDVTVGQGSKKGATDYNVTVPYGTAFKISNFAAQTGYVFTRLEELNQYHYKIQNWDASTQTYTGIVGNNGYDTYVAVGYRRAKFTIAYNLNGGSNQPASTSATYNVANTITSTKPTRTGYTFAGWKAGDGTVFTSGQKITATQVRSLYAYNGGRDGGTITLTAQWTKNKYNIKYSMNNGTNNPSNPTSAEFDNVITLYKPTKAGWKFTGWTLEGTNPNYSTAKYGSSASAVTTAISNSSTKFGASGAVYVKNLSSTKGGEVTLVAHWEKTLTVNFWSGIAKKHNQSQQITIHDSATSGTVTAPVTPTDPVWTFVGWTQENTATASTKYITGGTKVTITATSDDDTKLDYYCLSRQLHTLKYDANGGTGAPESSTAWGYYNSFGKQNNGSHTISSVIPKRTGYTFGGWYREEEPNTLFKSGDTYTNHSATDTLYAQWTAHQYTVKYDGNGYTSGSTASSSHTFDVPKALTANGFNRNYTVSYYDGSTKLSFDSAYTNGSATFRGWSLTSAGAKKYEDKDSVVNLTDKDGGTVTLYAVWSFATVKAPSYSKDNFVFLGWSSTNGGEVKYIAGSEISNIKGNITLYAVWIDKATADSNAKKYVETTVTYGYDATTGKALEKKLTEALSGTELTNYNDYINAVNAYNAAVNAYNNGKSTVTNAENYRKAAANLASYTSKINSIKVVSFLENMTVTFKDGKTENNARVGNINLNHYSMDILSDIKTQYNKATALLNNSIASQKSLNELVMTIAQDYVNRSQVKSDGPAYKVYENADKARISEVKDLAGATAVNYVYAGKGNYTYYCYTNSKNPEVLITVDETSSRVCYPTKATNISAVSSSSDTKAQYDSKLTVSASNIDRSYATYIDSGIGLNSMSKENAISYYKQKAVIKLNPVFGKDKDTVTYVFKATDDALTPNVAKRAALSSGINDAANTYSENLKNNENKITIVISYHYSGEQMNVSAGQVDGDAYLNQYHLLRYAGGAKNWELPYSGDTVYTVNDGTYGQRDYGSFTYTFVVGSTTDLKAGKMKDANLSTVIDEFKKTDPATTKAFVGANVGGEGLGYIRWGTKNSTNWSFNYYPKTQNAYTYVHIVDRWGNVFDKVFKLPNFDYEKARAEGKANTLGAYDIIESGGSGIAALTLNATGFEILTDENSVMENNVFRTNGNTIRIKTGEANKSYTLNMKDKATNASTATVTSDENGIITLSITDEEYKSGVYTFKLNDTEINLYDKVNNHKYILEVQNAEVEEGETAELVVITTGEVIKARITDAYGNTKTITDYKQNDDGTRTWTFAKSLSAGEYDYDVTVKVGTYTWAEGSAAGKIKVNARILDSGRIISAEYDPATNLYKVKVEGRGTKVQFITPDGMTRTYTRHNVTVKSITSYDADGEETNDTSVTLDYEVWMIDAKLASKLKYKVAGKFEAGWNRADDAVTYVVAN